MGVAKRALQSSFPRGAPWGLKGAFGALISALGNVLDKLYSYMRGIVTESLPGTADETLAQWYEQLGIKYDPKQTLEARRLRASQAWTALGGQSKDYIEGQVQRAYPDVEIQEIEYNPQNMVGLGQVGRMQVTDGYPAWLSSTPTDGSFASFDYRAVGEVDTNTDLQGLTNLLSRIEPATHKVTLDITIRQQSATAEVGLGMVGLAQVGRTKSN